MRREARTATAFYAPSFQIPASARNIRRQSLQRCPNRAITWAVWPTSVRVLLRLPQHGRQTVCDAAVSIWGGVLVDHGGLGTGMAQSRHELLCRGPGAGGQCPGRMPKIVKSKSRHTAGLRRWQPDPVSEVVPLNRQPVRRREHVGTLSRTDVRIEMKLDLDDQRLGKRDRSLSRLGLWGSSRVSPLNREPDACVVHG